MAFYTYICEVCGKRFRTASKLVERDRYKDCPRCRSPFGRRVLSSRERARIRRGDQLAPSPCQSYG